MYCRLDIGTAKPQNKARYELIDVLDPTEAYGVGRYVGAAAHILGGNYKLGRSCIMVGGTGLYMRAVLEEYDSLASKPDPDLREKLERRQASEGLEALFQELEQRAPDVARKVDPRNPARVRRALERLEVGDLTKMIKLPPFRQIKLGISQEPDDLYKNIESRTQTMIKMGWLEEIEQLRREGYVSEHPGFRAIGYRALWEYLDGKSSLEEAVASTNAATRQYAKRQRTWLRSEPRLQMLPQGTRPETLERAWSAIRAKNEGFH